MCLFSQSADFGSSFIDITYGGENEIKSRNENMLSCVVAKYIIMLVIAMNFIERK